MNMVNLFRLTALTSFFGLMITLICWITLAPHSPNFPTAAVLIVGVVPLLFPLRGLLHNRPYTHAWNSFLMLFYFSHAVGELYSADSIILYAVLELMFSLICFVSSILFIKSNAKLQNKSHK
jgi:uncharacterized membrane protein